MIVIIEPKHCETQKIVWTTPDRIHHTLKIFNFCNRRIQPIISSNYNALQADIAEGAKCAHGRGVSRLLAVSSNYVCEHLW